MALNKQVFTNAGLNMLGQANDGRELVISRIVVGSGPLAQDSDIFPLTALATWKSDVTITRKQDLGGGKMIVSGTLNEWEMPAGPPFPLRELGIMAHIVAVGDLTKQLPPLGSGILAKQALDAKTGPSGQPIVTNPSTFGSDAPAPHVDPSDLLYCASNVYGAAPDTVTPGGTTSRSFDITIEIDRATNVTITIGGVGTYDCQNVPVTPPANSAAWYAGREGNVFDFKRVIQGPGIIITETADRITIGQAVLTQNVDLYVPASHPQCPNPDVGFATIQAAHDYLLTFRIPAALRATIHVYKAADGFSPIQIVSSPGITFTHPDSKQINLIGEPRVEIDIANPGIVSSGGGATKNITLTNATPVKVGQRIYVRGTSPWWAGSCKVTAKTGNLITCTKINAASRVQRTDTDVAAAGRQVRFYPTVIAWNTAQTAHLGDFLLACPNGIGSIQNICFDGSWYVVGIESGGITDCQIIGTSTPTLPSLHSRRGLSIGSGYVGLGGECVISDVDFGITGPGVFAAFTGQYYVTGCFIGVLPSGSGYTLGAITGGQNTVLVYIVACYRGIDASQSGNYNGAQFFLSGNDVGVRATMNGNVNLPHYDPMPANYYGDNTTDFYADTFGLIQFQAAANPPVCSPTPAPEDKNFKSGNLGGYISRLPL
jgi:hypothetical protein